MPWRLWVIRSCVTIMMVGLRSIRSWSERRRRMGAFCKCPLLSVLVFLLPEPRPVDAKVFIALSATPSSNLTTSFLHHDPPSPPLLTLPPQHIPTLPPRPPRQQSPEPLPRQRVGRTPHAQMGGQRVRETDAPDQSRHPGNRTPLRGDCEALSGRRLRRRPGPLRARLPARAVPVADDQSPDG